MFDQKQAEDCAVILAALAEQNRIRIIECLRSGSKNVTQLSTLLDEEIVNVSHHLGVMRAARVVVTEKKGRFVIYSLNPRYFVDEPSKSTMMDLGWCRIEIPHN